MRHLAPDAHFAGGNSLLIDSLKQRLIPIDVTCFTRSSKICVISSRLRSKISFQQHFFPVALPDNYARSLC